MKAELDKLEHAFWDLVGVTADNLPEDVPDNDPETTDYVNDCRDRFENDKQEFAEAIRELRKRECDETKNK